MSAYVFDTMELFVNYFVCLIQVEHEKCTRRNLLKQNIFYLIICAWLQ